MNNIINEYNNFINQIDSIQLNYYIIFLTLILFLIIYSLKQLPIFSTLNTLLNFIPTLTHELGHAIVCSLTLGKVSNIKIVLTKYFQDKTGSQGFTNMHLTWFGNKILTTFAGYIMCPLILFLGIKLIHDQLIYVFLLILLLGLLYYLLKTSQKLVALIFISLLVVFLSNIIFMHNNLIILIFTILVNVILGLLLAETLKSIYVTFILTFLSNDDSWDGGQLAHITFLPQSIWFILWTLFDFYIFYQIFLIIF